MPGRQAKTLSVSDVSDLLVFASCTRQPLRNTVMVLLSAKAGLRAGEIANLSWDMVVDANGQISGLIELADAAAKRCSGRSIPIHPDLAAALVGPAHAFEFSEKKYDTALVLPQNAKRADEIEDYCNAENVGPVHGGSIWFEESQLQIRWKRPPRMAEICPGRPDRRFHSPEVCPASGLPDPFTRQASGRG
jgi:hypothetical protein